MSSELIRLSDYSLEDVAGENALKKFDFVLSQGDAFSIVTDLPDAAHHLLRSIATLESPKNGRFFYKGEELDLSDYRSLLPYKRKVGYIASDSTFVTNRPIRDNLMFRRYYLEDSTSIEMSDEDVELCRTFELEQRLDLHVHQLDPEEYRLFVIVRELSKQPEILLFDRPRAYLRTKNYEFLKEILRNLIKKNLALIFFSTDKGFINEFSNKKIAIDKGRVTSFASDKRGS